MAPLQMSSPNSALPVTSTQPALPMSPIREIEPRAPDSTSPPKQSLALASPKSPKQISLSGPSASEQSPSFSRRESPSMCSSFAFQPEVLPEADSSMAPSGSAVTLPVFPKSILKRKRKTSQLDDHHSITKRVKFSQEEPRVFLLQRTSSSPGCVTRVPFSSIGLRRSLSSPKDLPQSQPCSRGPASYVKNYTCISIKSKIAPGTFKFVKRTSKPSENVLQQSSSNAIEVSALSGDPQNTKGENTGESIVDFMTFSHDVTLYKIVLSFDGKLDIQDLMGLKSLRTVTSDIGEFVFEEPLVLRAGKSYGIYLNSRFESVALNVGTTWKIHFSDVTLELGHCTIVGGIQLMVSS
ncbi:uncharacterized protein LOC143025640 [Oratosquilla oratoria]|uniref:uncharacterized protein LOC143025640 n=1 Tax=Oratosquilla oratoria TaxID=337810 RepID=UPI003F765427